MPYMPPTKRNMSETFSIMTKRGRRKATMSKNSGIWRFFGSCIAVRIAVRTGLCTQAMARRRRREEARGAVARWREG